MRLKALATAALGLVLVQGAMATTVIKLYTERDQFKNPTDKVSYAMGYDIGENFKNQSIDINAEAFVSGLIAAQKGKGGLFTTSEVRQILIDFQDSLQQKFQQIAVKNEKESQNFLTKNKGKKGVVTLESGLQYRVEKAGSGSKPTDEDTVVVEYSGKLISGKVFDGTEKNGANATFRVADVIPGWSEALKLMKEGSTWELFIPSNLAYGPSGMGGAIGPNQALIFKVHLIKVQKESNPS